MVGGLDEATLTTSVLPVGTDSDHGGLHQRRRQLRSQRPSAAVSQVVNQDGTTTAVASSPNPSASGQLVTFTTTVTTGGPGTFDNGGMVQFLVDGTDYGSPVPLTGGTASISDSSLTAGGHTITATYSGDTGFSSSTGNLTQGVIGVLTVTNNRDSGAGSLRAAIAAAVSGDTIEFATNLAGETITLASTLAIGTSLQIEGPAPAS